MWARSALKPLSLVKSGALELVLVLVVRGGVGGWLLLLGFVVAKLS